MSEYPAKPTIEYRKLLDYPGMMIINANPQHRAIIDRYYRYELGVELGEPDAQERLDTVIAEFATAGGGDLVKLVNERRERQVELEQEQKHQREIAGIEDNLITLGGFIL